MSSWRIIFGVACLVVSVFGFPSESQEHLSRLRRSPQHGMMIRGYFLRTPTYNTYYPRAAYGGGMAGVGSYYAPRRNGCRNCNQLEEDLPMAVPEPEAESDPRDEAPESVPVEDVTAVSLPEDREEDRKPEVEVPKEEEVPTAAPKPKSPKKPRTPKHRPIDVDDDEEDEVPRKGGRKGGDSPSYSNFFPTYFGGGASRRSGQGDDEGQNPGLVAIANSFSTGRGAIATSSATAFGGPAPAPPASRGSPSRYRS